MKSTEFIIENTLKADPDADLPEDFLEGDEIERVAQSVLPDFKAEYDTDWETFDGSVALYARDEYSLCVSVTVNYIEGHIVIYVCSKPMAHGKGGVITKVLGKLKDYAINKFGKGPVYLVVDDDASHGAWQHIASKIGIEYGAQKVK